MIVTKEFLVSVLSHFRIIHHTHGRLRLRVSSKIKDEFKDTDLNISLEKFDDMVNSLNGVKSVKFNKVIGSITIEYDKDEFSKSFWENIIINKDIDDFVSMINDKVKEVL
ncbi:HMA2 domain-containing protein [Campylobacter corcagiensis]|uniref:Cation transporter n=1 Tax=Campylobacter corcagiensis TaxID=1448857 RepID=A0A7M1LGN0_9BACT|nr:hypothetical protein [Campylobacter corcagiensis]QKF64645.1 hypothetical protein CCORG_0788 [Campylobacter corcagiensis]QOQ87184.1 hypothetical protein IMC76_08235 [Campylobacter corcagiensis]